jgi:hypothetical protein
MVKLVVALATVSLMAILLTAPLSAVGTWYSSYQFEPSPNYTQNDSKAVLRINSDIRGLPEHRVSWQDPQGASAPCSGCTTRYEYSSNGMVVASVSEFPIAGQRRTPGTYTAVVTYCSSQIGGVCISWGEMLKANFEISEATTVSHRVHLPFVMR